MSKELTMEERREQIMQEHGATLAKIPVSDGSRVTITKRSASVGQNSKGQVIVFRDSATKLRYTVSVNVSVASAKVNTYDPESGEDKIPARKATLEDIACFEGKIEEFLNTIQDEIK